MGGDIVRLSRHAQTNGSAVGEEGTGAPYAKDTTDLELLRAHVAGDSRAFAILAQRHHSFLRSVAKRHCGRTVDPSDCVQEGLARAMHSSAHFRGHCSVATWLSLLVKHACMDYHRGRFGTVPVCEDVEVFSTAIERLESARQDVALRLVMTEALAKLSKDQLNALVYLDVFGYSLRETARSTGQPSGTLKSRRARARTILRRQLGEAVAA
nr:sigma-70 family RNA polymerase sigma factor [Corynebacterium lactis]